MRESLEIKYSQKILSIVILLGLLTSCVGGGTSSGGRDATTNSTTGIANTPNSVSPGFGRFLKDNPVILSGNPNLPFSTNLNTLLTAQQDAIVDSQFLNGSCNSIDECFRVVGDDTDITFASADKKWAFDTSTDEFARVNMFAHIKLSTDKFHSALLSGVQFANSSDYNSSLPSFLDVVANNAHWNGPSSTRPVLTGVADCNLENNAVFKPSQFEICMGFVGFRSDLLFAEDNTIIYHELGHAYVRSMANIRNFTDSNVIINTDIGALFYDEALSINEGIADYISYFQNERTHFGEWGLGRPFSLSRPMSEADPIHAPGISTNLGERLSYPAFLLYNPNQPDQISTDVHAAGSIIAHYLTALNQDLVKECSITTAQANQVVIMLLAETFAELGDLTTKGNLGVTGSINLNTDHAQDWIKKINPITFRKFAATFAKYQKLILTESNLRTSFCPFGTYTVDNIEFLLDQYGLLLFKTYNEDGNHPLNGHSGAHTAVSTLNRVNSILINKDNLVFDPRQDANKVFVFDNRSALNNALQNAKGSQLEEDISHLIEDGLPYNNGNGSISPGEFVGLSVNLFNESNSTMGGVQVLANDWDHTKDGKPCNTFEDNFPSDSQGAADLSVGEGAPGGCDYITRSNGDEAAEELAPVCLVLLTDGDASRYGSQEELRSNMALDPNECHDQTDSKDCFIRFPKGLDQSVMPFILPNKNFAESIPFAENIAPNKSGQFDGNTTLFMEVSPWIPPGTTFSCRLRARFSNCDDCFHDENNNNDDFLDFEYSGGKPFKILNFEFTVVD